ncbi:MAG: energy transducer TonB [Rikenellaceae bacterium]
MNRQKSDTKTARREEKGVKPISARPAKKRVIDKNDPRYIIYSSLPFKKRKMDFSEWIYRNKLGVITISLAFIVAFLAVASVRFQLTSVDMVDGFFIDIPQEEEPIVEEEEITKEEQLAQEIEKQMYEDIQNRRSNESASNSTPMKDDRGTNAQDLYDEAQQLQARLDANRKAYQKGLAEEAAINNSYKKGGEKSDRDEKPLNDTKVNGKVTVSYDLDGRRAVYLPTPAYKCESGGEVIIKVIVNNNGDVISADVGRTTAKNDNCINDAALSFAKKSRFEVSDQWGSRHRGTITYLFLQQ